MSGLLKNKVFQSELTSNIVSLISVWLVSLIALSEFVSLVVLVMADSVPSWALAVLREWRRGQGFF